MITETSESFSNTVVLKVWSQNQWQQHIAWELIGNANSRALPRTNFPEILRTGPEIWVLTSSPVDSDIGSLWESIALPNQIRVRDFCCFCWIPKSQLIRSILFKQLVHMLKNKNQADQFLEWHDLFWVRELPS